MYSLPSSITVIRSRIMRWAGHVAHMKEIRDAYKILARKPEEKGSLGRSRWRWVDIKFNLKEIRCESVDWIQLVQAQFQWQALVNMVIKFQVLYNSENFLIIWMTMSFSERVLHYVINMFDYMRNNVILLLCRYVE